MSILSLKEAALAAYKEQQEVDAERLAERTASIGRVARQTFVNAFGIEPDGVETIGKNTIVTAGDIVLRYEAGSLNMWGVCPRCQELAIGQAIGGLESLGKALADGFTPHWLHFERDCQPAPTPEPDPMLAALQGIAAELKNIAAELEIANGKNF